MDVITNEIIIKIVGIAIITGVVYTPAICLAKNGLRGQGSVILGVSASILISLLICVVLFLQFGEYKRITPESYEVVMKTLEAISERR